MGDFARGRNLPSMSRLLTFCLVYFAGVVKLFAAE
jgi:hypothetical protein